MDRPPAVRSNPEAEAAAVPVRRPRPRPAVHPRPRDYVRIAVYLAIVTAAEVALFYLEEIPRGVVIALLFFLSSIKFSLVVLWYMHLKFDSVVFARLFTGGFALAATVYVVVLLTLQVFGG